MAVHSEQVARDEGVLSLFWSLRKALKESEAMVLQASSTVELNVHYSSLRFGPFYFFQNLLYNWLSPDKRDFLLSYYAIMLPTFAVMVISLCSIVRERVPWLVQIATRAKRPVFGGTICVVSLLCAIDIFCTIALLMEQGGKDDIVVHIIVSATIPSKLLFCLSGFVIGLHILQVLQDKQVSAMLILEAAGMYLSVLAWKASETFPLMSSYDDGNVKVVTRSSHHFKLKLFSLLVLSLVIQSVGLSFGVSVFHEMGVYSARLVGRVRKIIFSSFILRCAKCIASNSVSFITNLIEKIRYLIESLQRGLSKLRQGDKFSRLLKYLMSEFSEIMSVHVYPVGVQQCQNIHIILSFASFHLQNVSVKLYLKLLDKGKHAGHIFWSSCLMPVAATIADAAIFVVNSITTVSSVALRKAGHIWAVVKNRFVAPCLNASKRIAIDLAWSLCQAAKYTARKIIDCVLTPLSSFIKTCFINLYRAACALGQFIPTIYHSVSLQLKLAAHRIKLELIPSLVEYLSKKILALMQHPLVCVAERIVTFIQKFSFAIVLLIIGFKFFHNATGLMSYAKHYSKSDILGLCLGGYVSVVVGLMLVLSKSRPFFMRQALLHYCTICYWNLDLTVYSHFKLLLVKIFQKINQANFSSLTKCFGFAWKSGFDVFDGALTVSIHFINQLIVSFTSNICVPSWKYLVNCSSCIWNSPYVSLVASLSVMSALCLYHSLDIEMTLPYGYHIPDLRVLTLYWKSGWYAVISIFSIDSASIGNALEVASNHSLIELTKMPSFGWLLYALHIIGSSISYFVNVDPVKFARCIMKAVFFPLLVSSGWVALLPGVSSIISSYVEFGKCYFVYFSISFALLFREAKKISSAPNMRDWRNSRMNQTRLRTRVNEIESSTQKQFVSPKQDIPFEYLKLSSPPTNRYEYLECPICLEGMPKDEVSGGKGTSVLCLPCGHIYHQECILEWLRSQGDCPSCREVVPPTVAAEFPLNISKIMM